MFLLCLDSFKSHDGWVRETAVTGNNCVNIPCGKSSMSFNHDLRKKSETSQHFGHSGPPQRKG